ncbi:MAG: aminotransferase class I/II-fold pyridoxal phosphate-dependent enzyme [Oscillospiraceae bacterium]|nr:aminotransferase class I/II-fold pyridoxal phosphate-dependent enzyme [Oscillospiraceae bacterium]
MERRFDFDTLADRANIGCMKFLETPQAVRAAGLISFAGAEADFKTAPAIMEGMIRRARGGFLGYTVPDEAYRFTVCSWMKRERGWQVEPEWIVPTGGTIRSVATALRMTTEPGEGMIVQPPVYFRYKQAADRIGRKTVYNPLKRINGRYEMDFGDLERCMENPKNRLMVLCNPHNPIGQVWGPSDLAKVARLARQYGVTVFSDEIFAETVYNGHQVQPYSEAADATEHAMVSTSLGKAFSLTGVNFANLIIPDRELRERFIAQRNGDHYGSIEPMAHAAMMAAYTNEGAAWLHAMNGYVLENIQLVRNFLAAHLPRVSAFESEGAFILWIDWHGLGLPERQLHAFLEEEALFLTDRGEEYGPGGAGFTRMNMASPKAEIQKALDRLLATAKKRGLVI